MSSVQGQGQARLRSNASSCFSSSCFTAFGLAGRTTGLYESDVISSPPGAVAIGALLRGWRRNADVAAAKRAAEPVTVDTSIDATPDELARLQAALREER